MKQESEMLQKRSFRENLRSVVRIVKKIHSMDHTYYVWILISALVKAVAAYGAILLSSFIVTGLSMGGDYAYVMKVTVSGAVLLSLAASADYFIGKHLELKEHMIDNEYVALQQGKLMDMDFSLIDSPRLKEIRERMQRERNWGAGIYSVFWQGKNVLQNVIMVFVAAALLISGLFEQAVKWKFETTVLLLLLCLGMLAGLKVVCYLAQKMLYFMFHLPTREEKEWFINYVWDFAMQGKFQYENGKDVRIFDAYHLMKAYTYDRLQGKKFQNYVFKRSSWIEAGLGMVGSGIETFLLVGSYLLSIIMAKQGGMNAGAVLFLGGCFSNFLISSFHMGEEGLQLLYAARQQEGIFELLELADEMYKGSLPLEKRSDGEYQIEFRNVSFRYPGSKEYALKNFSMKLKVGERLAIVGKNGSGKTTMIKLLCRLYDPDEGEILLNGVNIKKYRHEEYAALFSVVFQDYTLFSLEIGENVAVSQEPDADRVRKCLQDSGFKERFDSLSKGMKTYLYKDYEDEGVEISGGEAQKLAMARALYKNAPFVLLDEPTAALDPVAESEIYTNFDKIVGNKTAVYISHRLSSCMFCDRIAVFKEGMLVQYGSHEELLLDADGEYAVMWNKQAMYYVMA